VHTLTCRSFIIEVDGSLLIGYAAEYFSGYTWSLLRDSMLIHLHDLYYEFIAQL